MAQINLGKFLDCLVKYKKDTESTVWTKREVSKFYFANLLARRIQLEIQSPEMIFEICNRIQDKDFYFHSSNTKIRGIQFLKNTGRPDLTEEITFNDVSLFKFLSKYENLLETDYEIKSLSYQSLSGWLGTLIPHKFLPVTSGEFRHTIAYLFDIEPCDFQENEYEYFIHSQSYFDLTKQKLKQFELESLYLKEIAEYIKFIYPKSAPKRSYTEYDWNWVTQDFHLYIYREVLGLDSVGTISRQRSSDDLAEPVHDYQKAGLLNIYIP